MRTRLAFSALCLLAVPAFGQTSFFNEGFLRQGNAALDRAYLGITNSGVTTNVFFATNATYAQFSTNWLGSNSMWTALSLNPFSYLTANQPITLTGDVTGGPAPTSIATTLKNTGTAGTYTKTTFDAQGRETAGSAAALASADYANQGTTTTVLHGNAAGNPAWGAVSLGADVSGLLPAASWQGATNTWNLTGNTLGNTNSFLGSIDNVSLKFKVNNSQVALFDTNQSISLGTNVVVTGTRSFGAGATVSVSGNDSVGIGSGGVVASSPGSTAVGFNSQATGVGSSALGYGSEASGYGSTAIGFSAGAGGQYSFACGYTAGSGILGDYSIALGNGAQSLANSGNNCLACGYQAHAFNNGSFVWSDSTGAFNTDSADNQFVETSTGGAYFYTSPNDAYFDANVHGTIFVPSDANLKTNLLAFDGTNALSMLRKLPVYRWRWRPIITTNAFNHPGTGRHQVVRTNLPDSMPHIGPIAQDWQSAVGGNGTNISVQDEIGVLLAAVKELDARVLVLEARLRTNQ